MLETTDLRGADLDLRSLRAALPRAEFNIDAALADVAPICARVRDEGAAALLDLTEQFDQVRPERLRVPAQALSDALATLPADVRSALETSIERARRVHQEQLPREHSTEVTPGGRVAQRWIPVARVGLYVPGGRAVYPSSVVMNVVPAQAAGVGSIAVASPPQRDNPPAFAGLPHPTVLAACALLGVDEVYAIGGAQAIAAFAYGFTDTTSPQGDIIVDPVALVTGPGNIYVAAAKRHVSGLIGIDAEAGPTEIAILADAGADPMLIAADLVSQAEHDPLAASILVTDSADLATAVAAATQERAAATKHSERVQTALAGSQSGIVLVDDIASGLAVVNAYGAEHLEVHTADAEQVAARVTNAGAIFVGPSTPVSLGDYAAGSNHVLPTGGSSAHSSGLGVHSFLRSVQVISYDAAAINEVGERVIALAQAEDLPAHGEAIAARMGSHG